MTRWPAHGVINIIWTKKIYNDLHVRIYVEKIFLQRPFFLRHSFFLSLFLSLSVTLSLIRPLSLTVSPCIRLACTYSINREPRYCTASPHPSALVAFTLARASPHLRFVAVVTLSEAALVQPREQTHRFFRSNKYQQRDSYTGSNPSLSYALINYGLTI